MTNVRTFVAAVALTLLIGVPTAQAQHRAGGSGHSRGASGGSRGGGARSTSAPRSSGGAASRGYAPRTYSAPRTVGASRSYATAQRSYTSGVSRAYATGFRGSVGVVGRAAPRVIGAGALRIAPVRFFQPYYAFRPRLNLGFGLWAGFPISYYNPYYDPYYDPYASPAYGDPYPATGNPTYPPAGYPSSAYPPSAYPQAAGSVGVQSGPDQANTGGVSFEITPSTAQVFVDGSYVGTVGDFVPTTQPLGLTAGRHHLELRAPGYQTMSVDADIVAGQVIPYQGAMQR